MRLHHESEIFEHVQEMIKEQNMNPTDITSWAYMFFHEETYLGLKIKDIVAFEANFSFFELMTRKFINTYDGDEGENFIIWTNEFVYFSEEGDGESRIKRVSRSPSAQSKKLEHFSTGAKH